ncbi:MAG: 20S proteasome subunit A/B [Chthoniobacteraceae bacterium]|jgi:proteasome alpha subunit
MTEEPYRWVEAISNRREYIEHQLAGGSPIVALSYSDGILFLTMSRERQKIFEIYDRIAMGAIGHPGDIERLRMAAIEVASTEGFTRSTRDVSLRRLAAFSLSPALKGAFEQIYGPPYLTRMLFAELGREGEGNLFVRMDYDGTMHSSGGPQLRTFEDYGVLAGTAAQAAAMERHLAAMQRGAPGLDEAIRAGLETWTVGHLSREEGPPPTAEAIEAAKKERLGEAMIEAAVLERKAKEAPAYRALGQAEVEKALG